MTGQCQNSRCAVGLSRQHHWRDRWPLSRHCVPKPSKYCIFHLVAWQLPLVAPLPVARQSSFVAPPGVARQAQNSATFLLCLAAPSPCTLFTTRFQIQSIFVICSHKCLSTSVAPMIRTPKHILIKKH